jgi:glucose uptake protein GlcU
MRNKIRAFGSAISVMAAALPGLVRAQLNLQNPGYSDTTTNLPQGSIFGILTLGMQWLLGIVGILAVIAFVIAGIMYLTAAGDEDRIATAKKATTYAIIGLLVSIIGLILITAIRTLLTGDQGATQF